MKGKHLLTICLALMVMGASAQPKKGPAAVAPPVGKDTMVIRGIIKHDTLPAIYEIADFDPANPATRWVAVVPGFVVFDSFIPDGGQPINRKPPIYWDDKRRVFTKQVLRFTVQQ